MIESKNQIRSQFKEIKREELTKEEKARLINKDKPKDL